MRKLKKLNLLTTLFAVMVTSCMQTKIHRPVSRGDSYYIQATYYGGQFHGRKTSSGEFFDKNEDTCAIYSFPFGTILEVTNLNDGKKTRVRVTDRPGRNVIDLSEAAFSKIARKSVGRIPVRIRVVGLRGDNELLDEDSESEVFYTVQLGVFKTLDDAKKLMDSLVLKGLYIYRQEGQESFFKVRYGKFDDKGTAEKVAKDHFGKRDWFVVKILD